MRWDTFLSPPTLRISPPSNTPIIPSGFVRDQRWNSMLLRFSHRSEVRGKQINWINWSGKLIQSPLQ